MVERVKVPVTERAVIQRINRVLGKDERQLKKARGLMRREYGDYFILDCNRNHITGPIIQDLNDVAELARELGVLKPWEKLSE